MNKLPQITLAFWVMKICATTLGETAGDLLSMTLNVGYAVSSMLLLSVFVLTLLTQLFSKTYNPVLYWLVILSTSTAGTTMSDFMDRTLELGYAKARLEVEGHDALLVDCQLEGLDLAELRRRTARFAPEISVVVTAPSYLFWRCPPPELREPRRALDALRGDIVQGGGRSGWRGR